MRTEVVTSRTESIKIAHEKHTKTKKINVIEENILHGHDSVLFYLSRFI